MAFKKELKALIKLSWPLLIAQITQTLMGVSDTIMAGRFSAVDMAAVAIGFSITIPILCFVQGLAMAIPPMVSHHLGSQSENQISYSVQQAGYLVLAVSLVFTLCTGLVESVFSLVPMEAELRRITVDYVQYILMGCPAFAAYQVLRNTCEGFSITKPTMVIMAVGLVVNLPANYVLIYGKFGFPAMGGAGCGLATTLVFCAMFISTLLYTSFSRALAQYHLFKTLLLPHWHGIKTTLRLGLPIALTILFEVTLFGVVALMLSPFGATTVAAHQIALNFSSLMFMFPLSLGMATTIRVGYFVGKRSYQEAKNAYLVAITLGLSIAAITACITILARYQISYLYSTDLAVIELATSLMLLAAMFQLSDSIQAISAGALRGFKDTSAMFYITFTAYWLIGLPIGMILALTDWLTPALGAKGFWLGFIFGLTSAAILLGLRVKTIQKRLKETP